MRTIINDDTPRKKKKTTTGHVGGIHRGSSPLPPNPVVDNYSFLNLQTQSMNPFYGFVSSPPLHQQEQPQISLDKVLIVSESSETEQEEEEFQSGEDDRNSNLSGEDSSQEADFSHVTEREGDVDQIRPETTENFHEIPLPPKTPTSSASLVDLVMRRTIYDDTKQNPTLQNGGIGTAKYLNCCCCPRNTVKPYSFKDLFLNLLMYLSIGILGSFWVRVIIWIVTGSYYYNLGVLHATVLPSPADLVVTILIASICALMRNIEKILLKRWWQQSLTLVVSRTIDVLKSNVQFRSEMVTSLEMEQDYAPVQLDLEDPYKID